MQKPAASSCPHPAPAVADSHSIGFNTYARTMNVSLTPKLEAFVRRKVAEGLYGNASEVVREALRRQIEAEAATPGPFRSPA